MEDDSLRQVTERFKMLRNVKPFQHGHDLNAVFNVAEKTLWLIESFDAVMGNGPFEEFFTRPVSRYLEEIAGALVRIGADECAKVFTEAIEIFSPDLVFEREADIEEIENARNRRWASLSEAESEQLDDCFMKFLECAESEELMTRLERYLRANSTLN